MTKRLKPICHRWIRPLAGRPLLDDLVRLEEEHRRDRETQGLVGLGLMTSSNFAGSSIGKSAGLAPLRILSTYAAVRCPRSEGLAP
jgi:hypothetical protein